jgi:hypothetical protein
MVQHGGAMGAAVGHNGLYELHFYEDEGSPPGMHTHILEEAEEEEEEEQQQGLLRDVSAWDACVLACVRYSRRCLCAACLRYDNSMLLEQTCAVEIEYVLLCWCLLLLWVKEER